MKKLLLLLLLLLPLTMAANAAIQNQTVNVSGVVASADTGEPLAGVTIIANSGQVEITSPSGVYSIDVAPGTTLSYQYLGHATHDWIVRDTPATQTHDVKMASIANEVEEVVVVAYGTRKKGTIAGSVATVKADKMENVPAASFDQALQGQATGLTVTTNSGEPSAVAEFVVRGVNSINSGTAPLFIMDGIQISSSDFNAISPADIESVTVLKDAASTSIYGARAANGVVVITTKRGKMGVVSINYRMQMGLSNLASGKWNLMNTAERIAYEKEVGLTEGKDYDLLSQTDVDWRDEIFGNRAPLHSHEVQISGGNERTNFFISGGYFSKEGLTTDSDYSRASLRANMEVRASDWLKVGTNTNLSYETFSRSEAGQYYLNTPISASRFMLPYHNPYKPGGELASMSDGSWKGTGENPLEWVANHPSRNRRYKLISSTFIEATPVKGLTLRTQVGLDYAHQSLKTSVPASYATSAGTGRASKSWSNTYSVMITNTATYAFDIDKIHRFNFMLGQEGLDYSGETLTVGTAGQINDKLTTLSSGTRAESWSDSSARYALVSTFARGEYNYKGRYTAEFSVRGDWSSRFGRDSRGGAFWSVGGMWNVLGEDFVSDTTRRWLTNAQIAVSTGTAGNQEIPHYDHLALVNGNTDYMDRAGLVPVSKGNPSLSWEQTWSSNMAFKVGLWNRVNVELEIYNKSTSRLLMRVPVSYSDAGYGSRWANVGRMANRGVELNVTGDVIRTENGFAWSVSANTSYNRNKITELYDGGKEFVQGITKYQVGKSYGEFFYNRYAGVNPANGDALWLDVDGNITNEFDEDDRVMLGKNRIAPWQGGFGTTLSWRGVQLSAQFTWVANRWMINNDRYFEEGNGAFDAQNQSKRLLYDRWKNPGDVTDIPRHGVIPQFDTHLLEDASYLRIKNLSIGYTFPKKLLEKTGFVAGARVYAQAQNLLTFTKFSGLDPEYSGGVYAAQYPPSRQYTFGLDLTF
jgi:TonB-linked SusC/RagA family outer membrane protein